MLDEDIGSILYLANLLEECQFAMVWQQINKMYDLCSKVIGFNDSIRKFVCHVVGITFQTINKSLLIELLGGKMQISGKLNMYFRSILLKIF